MEQVIFLHTDEESEETLSQIQKSLAQRLVLVAPAQMDRLHLSLVLRLARRYTIAQAKQLCVVSEDRLAQMLATRMGFAVASTLDEYRGLAPGRSPSFSKRRRRSPARPQPPGPDQPKEEPDASDLLRGETPRLSAPQAPSALPPEKPGANLKVMLVDGYLANPAALPDLEEEAEQAEREERERLYYEISDEEQPSQAQQEAEQHEERIIARILKTRHPGVPPPAPSTPAPEAPADQVDHVDPLSQDWQGALRPMRTIDEMLRERGRGEIFDWFERQAAETTSAGSDSPTDAPPATSKALIKIKPGTEARTPAPPQTAAPGAERLAGPKVQPSQPARPGNRLLPRPPGPRTWRRIGIISALALSLVMTGLGVALIPSAEVGYHEEITPYNDLLIFDAHAEGTPLPTEGPSSSPVVAELARFDGIATAQASASGQRTAANTPNHLIAFPTQADVDQIADRLQTQLQQWGENALRDQADQGDILGPTIASEETVAFPAVGTSLPDGVSQFRVSVALHLRATLIRHQALLQATQQQLLRNVSKARPGFAPIQGQTPKLSILSVAPAGPGEAQLELLVRVQARAMIGPALTPEQVRAAIAGKEVLQAQTYLEHWPGITHVSIQVVPGWPNRLPVFSARIFIRIVSTSSGTARMA